MGGSEAQLTELLDRAGLGPYAAIIKAAVRPAVEVVPQFGLPTPALGSSRLGGAPDVPRGFTWPRHGELAHSFVGQFRLSELADLAPGLLPHSGLLSFFVVQDPEGEAFFRDDGYARAFLFPEGSALATMEAPPPTPVGPQCAVTFVETLDLPYDRYQWRNHAPGAEPPDDFRDKLRALLRGPRHYLLGYPSHCTLAYDPTPGPDWTALLCLGTDDQLGWCWGDGDRLMLFIRREDLLAARFDRLIAEEG